MGESSREAFRQMQLPASAYLACFSSTAAFCPVPSVPFSLQSISSVFRSFLQGLQVASKEGKLASRVAPGLVAAESTLRKINTADRKQRVGSVTWSVGRKSEKMISYEAVESFCLLILLHHNEFITNFSMENV